MCLELPLRVKVTRLGLVEVRQEEGDSDRALGVPTYAPSCVLDRAMLGVYPWLHVLRVWNFLYRLSSPD